MTTARFFQRTYGVQRQHALVPQAAGEARITTTLSRQFTRCPVGLVANGFHSVVGKFDCFSRGIRKTQFVQAISKPHDAQPHRTMAQVGVARFRGCVKVDVDDVVEHAQCCADGACQFFLIELTVFQMRKQIDRAKVANGGFRIRGVERDLGTQVARMHHPHMLLRRAQVAGILERDPRMARLKQHGQHLAPQLNSRHGLVQFELSIGRPRFVAHICCLKRCAKFVV